MSTTITFSPALPCSVLGADGVSQCSRPATAGTIYPMGGGQHILQPICRDCVQAIRWLYIEPTGERQNEERRGAWEPDGDPFEDARKAQ
jgi:hypothetical protein